MTKHQFEYDDATYSISAPGHVLTPISAIFGRLLSTEDKRQERWHRTRDAAVTGYLSNAEGPTTDISTLMELAEAAANEAHGPLDARAEDPQINDLVRAADDAKAYFSDRTDDDDCDMLHDGLAAALKPFEVTP